jgi:protein-S-isoprenylcysteine O-methyltransferase Ste14
VITGLYRHVRNPIYFGALLILFGFILWFSSAWIILYTSFAFIAFHFLIIVIEEPILQNTFGVDYDEYRKNVPRWTPRLSRKQHETNPQT